jgi:hypothetical protein
MATREGTVVRLQRRFDAPRERVFDSLQRYLDRR